MCELISEEALLRAFLRRKREQKVCLWVFENSSHSLNWREITIFFFFNIVSKNLVAFHRPLCYYKKFFLTLFFLFDGFWFDNLFCWLTKLWPITINLTFVLFIYILILKDMKCRENVTKTFRINWTWVFKCSSFYFKEKVSWKIRFLFLDYNNTQWTFLRHLVDIHNVQKTSKRRVYNVLCLLGS